MRVWKQGTQRRQGLCPGTPPTYRTTATDLLSQVDPLGLQVLEPHDHHLVTTDEVELRPSFPSRGRTYSVFTMASSTSARPRVNHTRAGYKSTSLSPAAFDSAASLGGSEETQCLPRDIAADNNRPQAPAKPSRPQAIRDLRSTVSHFSVPDRCETNFTRPGDLPCPP